MQTVDSLFLEADKALDEKKISSAKELLEEILLIDPGHSRAHNYMGWIFDTKFKDLKKAELHYSLALKFSDGKHVDVYPNYVNLLINFAEYEKALKVIDQGLKQKGVSRDLLVFLKGKIAEHKQGFVTAFNLYRLAQKLSFNREFIRNINNDVERVFLKMNVWQKLKLRMGWF